MSRSERLLQLLQLLRGHRYPISGAELANQLNISLRTLYRDIRSLQAQGAIIEGEAGLGYVLREGFVLPPLMFSAQEIEALVLGARWVAERADAQLAEAATQAMSKISAVVTPELRYRLDESPLLVGPSDNHSFCQPQVLDIRRAIEVECKLVIQYQDQQGQQTERTIWPFAIGFFDNVRLVVGWCELRNDSRNFRVDRIASLKVTDIRYPRRRQTLLNDWYRQKNIPRK
ncbi:helix-turn-helix transcriptional regulator [Pragia fontium]|uniref:Predicted DNA-binding transcriptional regulator YafY, contains an HTH and WYL domains n=1 Tax=Pragia fontium DSM 5563 = ATCC 49100 TaxID=1122977 RepID=A0AAJ5BHM0_9GAMM|nr:YafY family protein [Pragia fontium]SFD00635.1 Predicted DNA-binding transcriptional regulator YafY, contains an HTH and WYL domains [Pragia fontium DSM 5563 = ATCC 49100]VEJ55266.1 HTH domain [Pragia fontium]